VYKEQNAITSATAAAIATFRQVRQPLELIQRMVRMRREYSHL